MLLQKNSQENSKKCIKLKHVGPYLWKLKLFHISIAQVKYDTKALCCYV